jgi:glycosyltransferase involved in cell wall biosynthesis
MIIKRNVPNKILFIHHDGNLSGSTISLGNLLANLDRDRYIPQVLLGSEGPAKKLYESLGIHVDTIPIRTFGTSPGSPWYKLSWWLNWRAFLPNKQLSNYLAETEWDLLHINDKALLGAGLCARKFSKPIVWHLRSSYYPTYSRLSATASRKTIQSIADHIIAISEDEIDGFEQSKNLTIIYNSVNFTEVSRAIKDRSKTRSEFGLTNDDILIGQVSTVIGEVRGTWDFLKACGTIRKSRNDLPLKFMIVAKIPQRDLSISRKWSIRSQDHPEDLAWQLARDNKINDCLILTGYRKDALKIMAAMDVIVVCNRHGVLGRMPFEAMALGRPLVATSGHSGNSKVVLDQKTALVVSPRNSSEIAKAVSRIITDMDLARKISAQGSAYAREHFDPIKNTRFIEKVYRDLLI